MNGIQAQPISENQSKSARISTNTAPHRNEMQLDTRKTMEDTGKV
jgi:hypothetical protein